MAQDIFFQGIASPLRLVGADHLPDLLARISFGWAFSVAAVDESVQPFFVIRAEPGADFFLCENRFQAAPPRRLDALNALCDAIAALAVALPNSDTRLICLHAAAVVVAGRLLIFPNVRKAGKSTLSVALSVQGHALLGDDVVPLSFETQGRAWAHAMGIAPRLRLPLPDAAGEAFRDAVRTRDGVENRQYRYVRIDGQPARGAVFPDPTFVILDRRDDPVPAELATISGDQAMDVLMFQNFTRDRHSGDVLRAIAPVLAAQPVYRLTYSDLAGAVRCLEDSFAAAPRPACASDSRQVRPFRMAVLGGHPPCALSPGLPLRQRPGTERQEIGGTLYLADAEGMRIHRMDALAALIWDLVSTPITPDEVSDLLAQAFPQTPPPQIAADLDALLQKWAGAGLIEPAP